VESITNQDIPTKIVLIDNGSSDETVEWAESQQSNDFEFVAFAENRGVSYGWNMGLRTMFEAGTEYVLVPNNDVYLPAWFYSTLLSYDVPFVTGISVGSMEEIATPPERKELAPSPDFSCFLIRRSMWDMVGPLDEKMINYASDLDWHIRAHRAGIHLMNAGVPFYHERSSTLNMADPIDRRRIQLRADEDRAVFTEKWGVSAGGPDYQALFLPELFGVDDVKTVIG
jgi:GT2 family glycosyltransferase